MKANIFIKSIILNNSDSWQEISFLSNFNILVGMLVGWFDLLESNEDMTFYWMILIDLQKAFDTTDHQILLKTVKYLGFLKTHLHGLNPISLNRNLK